MESSVGNISALSQLEKDLSNPFTYNKTFFQFFKDQYIPEYFDITPKQAQQRIEAIKSYWLVNKTRATLELKQLESEVKAAMKKAKIKIKERLDQLEQKGADVSQAKEALEKGQIKQAYILAKQVKPPKVAKTQYQEQDNKLAIVLGLLVITGAGVAYYLYKQKPQKPQPKKLKSFKDKKL